MTRIITKAELARWAGVARSTAKRACDTHLTDAMHDAGVDVDHPIVREWLGDRGCDTIPDAPEPVVSAPTPPPRKAVKSKPPPTKPRPVKKTRNEMEHLEDLTVREVVMRYGSVDGFKRFVDSLKSISEFKYKELRAKQQRGDLVERSKVAGVVFPLIDVAFSRLVTDVPVSVSKQVVARVQSGGLETYTDVQKIIMDANSRVLKNVKQSAMKLEILKDAD